MTIMSIQQFANELGRATRAMNENRWSDAITDLSIVHERTPDNIEAAGKLAFALSRDGRYRDAVDVLEKLHSRQPEEPKWPYMIGYQYYEKKAWKEAIHWFEKALKVRPGYIKVLYRMGYAHVALAQENEAINALTDCIKYWERAASDAQERDRSIYSKAQFQLGKLLLSKGLSRKAARHLEIAVRIDHQNHDFLYELGQCHLRNNLLDEALSALEAADRIKPGTDYIIDRIAQTYARKGEYATAERIYERIPEHRRRHFVSQHLGMMYVDWGQHEKAIPHLQAALRKQPDNHNIHYALGCAQEAMGQVRKAHASYTRAIDHRRTKFNLAFKEAEEALKRTSELLEESKSDEETENSNVGVVESYDDARGFGFINTNSHDRIFFHISKFVGAQKPRRGSSVVFSSENSPKGLRAVHVELISGNDTLTSKTQNQQ